jgi:hypothetical protein
MKIRKPEVEVKDHIRFLIPLMVAGRREGFEWGG